MQNTVCKLTNKMLLGIMALSLSMPNQTEANMGYMVTATAGYNFLLRKMNLKSLGSYKDKRDGGAIDTDTEITVIGGKSDEVETERDFLRGLDLGVGFYAINKVNDIFGMGLGLNLGWSFSSEKVKDHLDSLYLNEGFVAKLGMAITITDWFMLNFGLRMSNLTLDYNKPDKKYSEATAKKEERQKYKDLTDYLGEKNVSQSAWAFGWYTDLNLLIPVVDSFKLLVTLGVFGDLNAPEFTEIYKSKNATPEEISSPIIENRLGMRIGLGVAFSF